MRIQTAQAGNLFAADALALLNGFGRIMSHMVTAPIETIADACDVAGLLAARRAARHAGSCLYRAAEREGHRSRRGGGLFGCFHYLSELT